MKRTAALAAMLMFTGSCGKQADDTAPAPQDFALSLPVAVTAKGPVQRIALPAAAIIALERVDKGDIRVFDARGRALSIALLDKDDKTQGEVYANAIPFSMPANAGADRTVSVRVDRGGQAVQVETGDAPPAGNNQAVLLDTRTLAEPVAAITLDASIPVQRAVTIALAAGTDLNTWQPLAEHVLFRPAEGAGLLGSGRIVLSGESLKDKYLRVSWSGASDVRVRGATLFTTASRLPQRIMVPVSGLSLADAHHLQFVMPEGARPSAMRVTMTGRDGVIPLRLLGRSASDEPWVPLALGSLKQGDRGALLEIGETGMREFRIEADARSAGFSAAPRVDFAFDPVAVLAAFNGVPPYRLAIGNAAADPIYFAPSELAKGPGPFPQAAVSGGNAEVRIDVTDSDGHSRLTPRSAALWAALIVGAGVLAMAAFRLLRANRPDA